MITITPEIQERREKLLAWLEAGAPHEKIRFAMDEGICFDEIPDQNISGRLEKVPECGTSACMAGATVLMFWPSLEGIRMHCLAPSSALWKDVRNKAAELLGLYDDQAEKLFTPPIALEYITTEQAASALRGFMETGEIFYPEGEIE